MKNHLLAGALLLGALLPAAAFLQACSPTGSRAGVGMPRAFIYSKYETPFTAKRTRGEPLAIPQGVVMGTSTSRQISLSPPPTPGFSFTDSFAADRALGAASVGWGNMGMQRAMDDAGIDEVIWGDVEELSILGLYTRLTIKVYGLPAERGEE